MQHGIRLYQNLYNVRVESKIPLVEVLEILKNFFQEVFKQGLGQSPKVFYRFITTINPEETTE